MEIQKTYPEKTLRDYWFVLFRHKRLIITFFSAVMLATILATFLGTKIYQSEAKLMVRVGRESVALDPTATTGQLVNIGQSRDNEIRSELEVLQSQALAEEVVDAIGYKKFLKPGWLPSFFSASTNQTQDKQALVRNNVLRAFMKNLEVENQKTSNIISVAFKGDSPDLTRQVTDKLISLYLDKHISIHRTPGSDEFFVQQTDLLRTNLAQAEENLRVLKNTSGISSVNEQRTLLLTRIGTLHNDLEQSEAALAAAGSKVRDMAKTYGSLPKTLIRVKVSGYSGNPVDYLQQKLHDLQLKEQDLLSKYTDQHNLVQEVRRQIDETQALLEKEGATKNQVSQLALLNEKATLAELKARTGALKQDLALAQRELTNLNNNENKVIKLQREIDLLAANYRNYSEKLEQARMDKALNIDKISNISVVQAATYPVEPIRPRKALNLALGFFLGTFGGLGLAFMAEYLDHTFKTPDDVNKILQVPVLATIPRFKIEASNPYALPKLETLPLTITRGKALIPAKSQDYCESILGQVRVALNRSPEVPTVLAVSSCYAGEGVSSVAAYLATAMAHCTNSRVLLMDANLDHPTTHKIFRVNQSPGLADSLRPGKVDTPFIQPSSFKNLDILAAGQDSGHGALPFDSTAFAGLMNLLRREYGFVLIDLPAIYEGNTAIDLALLADGLIFVIEAEQTRWQVAQQAKERLEQAQANVLGAVLNKREFYIPEWLYQRL